MQRVKDMLGDMLMTIAIWCDGMAGKLYDKREVDDALKELDRLVDEAARGDVVQPKTLSDMQRETHYPVGVVIGTRIANVWIPKGTMWVDGGAC